MKIRITAPFVEIGHTHYQQGRVTSLPDKVAQKIVDSKDAEIVTDAEYATMPRPAVNAVVPRPARKPKQPSKPKGK